MAYQTCYKLVVLVDAIQCSNGSIFDTTDRFRSALSILTLPTQTFQSQHFACLHNNRIGSKNPVILALKVIP